MPEVQLDYGQNKAFLPTIHSIGEFLPEPVAAMLQTREHATEAKDIKVTGTMADYWGKHNPDLIITVIAHPHEERVKDASERLHILAEAIQEYVIRAPEHKDWKTMRCLLMLRFSPIEFETFTFGTYEKSNQEI